MTSPHTALIFMTGRNCAPYVAAAIDSLARQTHRPMHVLFIDDASTDHTGDIARQLLGDLFPGQHTVVRNATPQGKAANAHQHLRAALPQGDFVVIVDADDSLILPTAVAQLAEQYAAGFDVVWTNFETDEGGLGRNAALDPTQPPRSQGWRTSHCFSFRAELFANIPEAYFRDDDGQWFTSACDYAIAFPVLDQTRRYRYLPVRAYRYTSSNPASHHNREPVSDALASGSQRRLSRQVLAKPPLPCTRWAFGPTAAADEVIAELQRSVKLAAQNPPTGSRPTPTPIKASPTAHPEAPDGHAWRQVAAHTLQAHCPALLSLAMDQPAAMPDIALTWRWWQWLQRGGPRPRLLEIGAGPLAAPLHAMVQALGGTATSVSGDRQRALALYAQLQNAQVTADVLHLPPADIALGDLTGTLPNLQALPQDSGPFDIVVISAAQAGARATDSLLTLPLLADRLAMPAFRLCLWAPDEAALREQAAHSWAAMAPELQFTPQAFGGRALCVHPT